MNIFILIVLSFFIGIFQYVSYVKDADITKNREDRVLTIDENEIRLRNNCLKQVHSSVVANSMSYVGSEGDVLSDYDTPEECSGNFSFIVEKKVDSAGGFHLITYFDGPVQAGEYNLLLEDNIGYFKEGSYFTKNGKNSNLSGVDVRPDAPALIHSVSSESALKDMKYCLENPEDDKCAKFCSKSELDSGRKSCKSNEVEMFFSSSCSFSCVSIDAVSGGGSYSCGASKFALNPPVGTPADLLSGGTPMEQYRCYKSLESIRSVCETIAKQKGNESASLKYVSLSSSAPSNIAQNGVYECSDKLSVDLGCTPCERPDLLTNTCVKLEEKELAVEATDPRNCLRRTSFCSDANNCKPCGLGGTLAWNNDSRMWACYNCTAGQTLYSVDDSTNCGADRLITKGSYCNEGVKYTEFSSALSGNLSGVYLRCVSECLLNPDITCDTLWCSPSVIKNYNDEYDAGLSIGGVDGTCLGGGSLYRKMYNKEQDCYYCRMPLGSQINKGDISMLNNNLFFGAVYAAVEYDFSLISSANANETAKFLKSLGGPFIDSSDAGMGLTDFTLDQDTCSFKSNDGKMKEEGICEFSIHKPDGAFTYFENDKNRKVNELTPNNCPLSNGKCVLFGGGKHNAYKGYPETKSLKKDFKGFVSGPKVQRLNDNNCYAFCDSDNSKFCAVDKDDFFRVFKSSACDKGKLDSRVANDLLPKGWSAAIPNWKPGYKPYGYDVVKVQDDRPTLPSARTQSRFDYMSGEVFVVEEAEDRRRKRATRAGYSYLGDKNVIVENGAEYNRKERSFVIPRPEEVIFANDEEHVHINPFSGAVKNSKSSIVSGFAQKAFLLAPSAVPNKNLKEYTKFGDVYFRSPEHVNEKTSRITMRSLNKLKFASATTSNSFDKKIEPRKFDYGSGWRINTSRDFVDVCKNGYQEYYYNVLAKSGKKPSDYSFSSFLNGFSANGNKLKKHSYGSDDNGVLDYSYLMHIVKYRDLTGDKVQDKEFAPVENCQFQRASVFCEDPIYWEQVPDVLGMNGLTFKSDGTNTYSTETAASYRNLGKQQIRMLTEDLYIAGIEGVEKTINGQELSICPKGMRAVINKETQCLQCKPFFDGAQQSTDTNINRGFYDYNPESNFKVSETNYFCDKSVDPNCDVSATTEIFDFVSCAYDEDRGRIGGSSVTNYDYMKVCFGNTLPKYINATKSWRCAGAPTGKEDCQSGYKKALVEVKGIRTSLCMNESGEFKTEADLTCEMVGRGLTTAKGAFQLCSSSHAFCTLHDKGGILCHKDKLNLQAKELASACKKVNMDINGKVLSSAELQRGFEFYVEGKTYIKYQPEPVRSGTGNCLICM